NEQGVSGDWRGYAVPVKDVEQLTGYSFFGSLPKDVAEELRSRKPQTRERATRPPPKEAVTKKPAARGLELPAFVEGRVIGNKDSKKYHLAGGRYYESSKTSKNAVFFRNEEDAKKAGYTKSAR